MNKIKLAIAPVALCLGALSFSASAATSTGPSTTAPTTTSFNLPAANPPSIQGSKKLAGYCRRYRHCYWRCPRGRHYGGRWFCRGVGYVSYQRVRHLRWRGYSCWRRHYRSYYGRGYYGGRYGCRKVCYWRTRCY